MLNEGERHALGGRRAAQRAFFPQAGEGWGQLQGIDDAYRELVESGRIVADPCQETAVAKLEALSRALAHYRPEDAGWAAPLGLKFGLRIARGPKPRKNVEAPRGIYLHGGVGRGKSMLMDLFHEKAPVAAKRRVHFHSFMREIHARIHRQGRLAEGDSIAPVADAIAEETTLLCFDEFHVTDIADAMILGRLFQALFERGVVVVATSNRAPDGLYRDGLHRDRFLPFIGLLKQKLDILAVDGGRDYRLERLAHQPVYHWPLDPAAAAALERIFLELTGGDPGEARTLPVEGRELPVLRATEGVAWFAFEELCGQPRGAADYMAVATAYHTVILGGIPELGPERRDEARRLNTLIDTLYEARINLVVSAAGPPSRLYRSGDGAFEFERTVSRLIEMQSADYIQGKAVPPGSLADPREVLAAPGNSR